MQVTVAILLNSFVGAINAAEEEAAVAAAQNMKSKEMLRYLHLVFASTLATEKIVHDIESAQNYV